MTSAHRQPCYELQIQLSAKRTGARAPLEREYTLPCESATERKTRPEDCHNLASEPVRGRTLPLRARALRLGG